MTATTAHDTIRAVRWQDNALELLDQRILPHRHEYLRLENVQSTAQAITDMVVRGAPAIGIAAAFGVVLAARARYAESPADWRAALNDDLAMLAQARPTAINLHWAIERMRGLLDGIAGDPEPDLLTEAQRILDEDIAANRHMGELGAAYIAEGSGILTHCNTGSLATGGYGTALGVIRSAHAAGKAREIFADETRPWLQGSRLTAWELVQDQIGVQVLADGAAAWLMKQGKIDWVIVGSDRIAANGDVANKIGTYSTAVLARHHGAKFMVVAPSSTVDMAVASGDDIPIETRDPAEIFSVGGQRVGAEGAGAWNPVFDVTPAELVDVIVTERGVVEQPTLEKMRALMG